MLSGDVPAAIVVGRELSAWSTADVQDRRLSLTYTVYNQTADPLSGVLLTTSLQPGVTLAGASQQPDRDGARLAWSLDTIGAFSRASVTIDVTTADNTVLQIDAGARAFAAWNAGLVTDGAPAAVLRADAIPAPLLAPTPDADAADPFIQEKAATLDYDPQAVFTYLQNDIAYNAYVGSLRGARGALWSGAANSVDTASLGVALLRASGIPAQYRQGALPNNLAQQLILTMFPAPVETVGYIPVGTSTSNPLNNSSLYADSTSTHTWFQFDTGDGKGMRDADPLIAGSTVGQSFASAQRTFSEVPDDQRHKTEITLSAEIFTQAAAAFGLGDGRSTAVVLQKTFNDVELVGRPVTIGHFVSSSGIGSPIFSSQTITYSPYIALGDDAFPDPANDRIVRGKDFQEVITNFPLGSQVLTGLFLQVKSTDTQGNTTTVDKTLFDRVGFAARSGAVAANVSINPNGAPAISPIDVTTISVMSAERVPENAHAPSAGEAVAARFQQFAAQFSALSQDQQVARASDAAFSLRQFLTALGRSRIADFEGRAADANATLARALRVAAYVVTPRVTMLSARAVDGPGGTGQVSLSLDLAGSTYRTIAAPGQAQSATVGFNLDRGMMENRIEESIFAEIGTPPASLVFPANTAAIFDQAEAQAIPLLTLSGGDATRLDALPFSADVKARIAAALIDGKTVLIPSAPVSINGRQTIGWYEIDRRTGETTGVLEDGSHGSLYEWAIMQQLSAKDSTSPAMRFTFGFIAGVTQGAFLKTAVLFLLNQVNNAVNPLAWLNTLKSYYNAVKRELDALEKFLANKDPFFRAGLIAGQAVAVNEALDPEVPAALIDVTPINSTNRPTVTAGGISPIAAGGVSASLSSRRISAKGKLTAKWSDGGTSSFVLRSLTATNTRVTDAGGRSVGTGVVSLSLDQAIGAAFSGSAAYGITGAGTLGVYGPAFESLGIGGDWADYSATADGDVSIVLTTSGLTLNGTTLPAGIYTIAANRATFTGGGPTSSPTFAGSITVTADNALVSIDPASGSLNVGGASLESGLGVTLSGYTGSIGVTAAAGDVDTITLNGNTSQVLQLATGGGPLSIDQNTPGVLQVSIRSSLDDSYSYAVVAPTDWTAVVEASGKITLTPAPGTPTGSYPIRVIARSNANPDFAAQAVVEVAVAATQPGLGLAVDPDPILTVPYNGAQLPTAFRATIRNVGPKADTFTLSSSNIPAGFSLQSGVTTVTIPAGETGVVGLYLVPNANQPLPAPGTQLAFTVTAKSTTDATITQTRSVSFTVPEIHGVTLSADPAAVATTPGLAASATITIRAVGNVAETITLTSPATASLAATGLSTITLQPGQSATQTLTVTPDAGVPLNSTLLTTVTASFSSAGSPAKQELPIAVRVVAPGVDALADATIAARELGDASLGDRFDDLAIALTNLVSNPADPVSKGQAIANIDSLVTQLTNHPFLSNYTAGLAAGRASIAAATTAAEIRAAVTALGQALGTLAGAITDLARHGFTVGLTPDRLIVQPGAPQVFSIPLTNTGTLPTTYLLSVSTLPAGVTSSFSQSSVTLQPGQSLIAGNNAPTLTLTETGTTLVPVAFTVTVTAQGATEIARSVNGSLTLRDESITVAGITTSPAGVDPGAMVNVSAKLLASVNGPSQASVSFTVVDPNGLIVFTSPATSVPLGVTSGLVTQDLGGFDTTGFVDGLYKITVSVAGGGSATTNLLIGRPVTADLSTGPALVPTGSETVTSTISVTARGTFPDPLSLLGAIATPAPGTSVAIYQAGGRVYAYESGTGGVDAFDVTDPSNPQLLKIFGQSDIVNGQFGFNIVRVVNDVLVVATTTTMNANGFNLLVYSLTDPTSPQFVSNTFINHRFLSDLLVNSTNTAAFVPTNGVLIFGGTITSDFGDFSAIDLSNPSQPTLASTLFNNRGGLDGGDMNQFGGTLVNDQIAYSAGLAPGGGTIIGNHGNLLVVDISDVTKIALLRQLAIPGTINILDVAVAGDRALVVGTAGVESNIFNPNAKGLANNLTLTVLDVTDPANPMILGSTLVTNHQFPLNETGGKIDVVALGNGAFAVSGTAANGQPALAVIDASDPNNIVVGATQVPSFVHGITVAGNKLYASTATGLSIYQIQALVSSPVTIRVDLPAGSAANIIAGSFNIAPTRINTSASGDSLVWNRSFAAGNTTYSFNWQTKLDGVTAGNSVPVTTGASITYVDQGNTAVVNLPGTSVIGASIIRIDPASATAQPGGSTTYNVRLSNPTAAAVTYNLSTALTKFVGQVSLPFSVTVPAGGAVDVPLVFKPFATTSANGETITVTADYKRFTSDFRTQLGDYHGTAAASVIISGPPVVQPDSTARGVVVQLTPANATIGRQDTSRFVVRVFNAGSASDSYNLKVDGLPNTVTASFDSSFVSVDPGATGFRDVGLVLTSNGADPGPYAFTVTAVSSSRNAVTGTATGSLNVLANSVAVSIDPPTGTPGSTYSLRVRNTGTVSDTFDLSLAGPAALVAKLSTATIQLEPGASQVVPVTTGAVDFASPGTLSLLGIATSRSAPSVQAADMSVVTIAETQGLTAAFETASVNAVSDGTAALRLVVRNTGNTEDAYTATIVGTSGPLTASLIGPDGLPTQSIPVFRLAGLASGIISIPVRMSTAGQGTVTVLITSLNDPNRKVSATGTVTASAVINVPGSAPVIESVERLGVHMQPTRLVVTFSGPVAAESAVNPANYRLVSAGADGRLGTRDDVTIRIRKIVYDDATRSVILSPARLLPIRQAFRLIVQGPNAPGIVDLSGKRLDGDHDGQPGGQYAVRIDRSRLVLPAQTSRARLRRTAQTHQRASPPAGPKAVHAAARHGR